MKMLCLVLAMLISCGCAHTANDQAKGAGASARRELADFLELQFVALG